MRRYRIMNQGLNTMLHQILLKFITTFAENWELMIYIILICDFLRQYYQRIIDMLIIISCQLLTLSIILIQILQLDLKNSSIQLAHTAIDTSILKYILLLTTIICQSTNHRSKFLITSSYCSCITKGTEIFAWIETMRTSIKAPVFTPFQAHP